MSPPDADEPAEEFARPRRLDPRTVIVQPIQQVTPLLPIPIAILVFGREVSAGAIGVTLITVVVLFVVSVVHWLRFWYRVADERLEVRSGLFAVRRRVVPLDRIRGVDVEARLTHRLLGVAVVRVDAGTGENADDALRLGSVHRTEAQALRRLLLRRTPSHTLVQRPAEHAPAGTEPVLLRMPVRWLCYAPLFGGLLLAVPGLIGAAYGAAEQLGIVDDVVGRTIDDIVEGRREPASYLWLAPVLLAALPLCALLVAALWYGRWVVLDAGHELRVERGVLTHRTVSLERARLRGTTLHEPLLGRPARAARLTALLSGLDGADRSTLAPLGPRAELRALAGRLTGTFDGTLRRHPPAALRRRVLRCVAPGVLLTAVGAWLGLPVVVGAGVLLAALGVPLAVDLYRSLGHGLDATVLAVRSGSFVRRTEVVGRADPIGIRVTQSLFQRRAGLATVHVALVAGGASTISDLAADDVAALVTELLPDTASNL